MPISASPTPTSCAPTSTSFHRQARPRLHAGGRAALHRPLGQLRARRADHRAADLLERKHLRACWSVCRRAATSSVTGATCGYTPATPAKPDRRQPQSTAGTQRGGRPVGLGKPSTHINIFGVRNDLDAGAEGGQEISNPVRTSYTVSGLNTVPSTNLANPNPGGAVFGGEGYISSITHTKSDSAGIFFLDTVHLSRLFELSLAACAGTGSTRTTTSTRRPPPSSARRSPRPFRPSSRSSTSPPTASPSSSSQWPW